MSKPKRHPYDVAAEAIRTGAAAAAGILVAAIPDAARDWRYPQEKPW